MRHVLYLPEHIALFVKTEDFHQSTMMDVTDRICSEEKEYLAPEYHDNPLLLRKHLCMVSETGSTDFDELIILLQDSSLNTQLPYMTEDSDRLIIADYFKIVRLQLLYGGEGKGLAYKKIKVRNLTALGGLRRRSSQFMDEVDYIMSQLRLQSFAPGHKACKIGDLRMNDMAIFRLK